MLLIIMKMYKHEVSFVQMGALNGELRISVLGWKYTSTA